MEAGTLAVKRAHGLGNVVCLLPVLDKLCLLQSRITVVTQAEWINAFSVLKPEFTWKADPDGRPIDLDALTESHRPAEHRTDELGRLLGQEPPFPAPVLKIPEQWRSPFEHLAGCVVFASEGGHPSRQWPHEQAERLAGLLEGRKLILIGTSSRWTLPAHVDLRCRLQLEELFGLLAVAGAVVTMDSGVLHLAAALQTPTVALFGGIDPKFRVRQNQHVVVLQSTLDCCPCNKNETCNGMYPCITGITAEEVIRAIDVAQATAHRVITRVMPATETSLQKS